MLVKKDRLSELTKAIFAVETPKVYEAYSGYDAEPRSFGTAEQVDEFLLTSRIASKGHFGFAIWYPSCAGCIEKKRIELDPKRVVGHSFRYSIEGWGIIHFQCDFRSDPLIECRIAVNSQARAIKWEPTFFELLPVRAWNWPAVEKHERRLLRKLRSISG